MTVAPEWARHMRRPCVVYPGRDRAPPMRKGHLPHGLMLSDKSQLSRDTIRGRYKTKRLCDPGYDAGAVPGQSLSKEPIPILRSPLQADFAPGQRSAPRHPGQAKREPGSQKGRRFNLLRSRIRLCPSGTTAAAFRWRVRQTLLSRRKAIFCQSVEKACSGAIGVGT